MIRLVVSNPPLPPRPPEPTREEMRAAAEVEHLALPMLDLKFAPSEALGASLSIWPGKSRTWTMTYALVFAGADTAQSMYGGFPFRLAAFDHAAACIRRACTTIENLDEAVAIHSWVDSLEVPK